MPAALITTHPSRWRRRSRTAGRIALTSAAIVLHLVVAVIVLALRITYAAITVTATAAAWAELYLAQRTGRPALGQTAGVHLAAAFTTGFRDAYHATTR